MTRPVEPKREEANLNKAIAAAEKAIVASVASQIRRRWDADKYTDPAQWPSLDSRIAAARAELDRPAPVRFPAEGRSCRVYRSNDR